MSFFLAQDALSFLATHNDNCEAIFELQGYTGCDEVEIERDGHCIFVHNGKVYNLDNACLVDFASFLEKKFS